MISGFPRAQGNLSREQYLTVLLIALVEQAGGELRIGAASLESVDNNAKLCCDWDVSAQQCVIRAATSSLIVSEVRGSWTSTTPTAQPSSSPVPPAPTNHRVMTEDEIITRMAEKLKQDQLRQWREQGAAAVAGMPPPPDRQ